MWRRVHVQGAGDAADVRGSARESQDGPTIMGAAAVIEERGAMSHNLPPLLAGASRCAGAVVDFR